MVPVGLTVELILPWWSDIRQEAWLGAGICFGERDIMKPGLILSLSVCELVGFRVT